MAPLTTYKDFFTKVTNLTALIKDIPETVPLATKDDEIYRIFEKFPLPEQMSEDWEVFNRRMDILFGENVRDRNGHLSNLRHGPYGMDLVTEYLLGVMERGFLLWEALVKVEGPRSSHMQQRRCQLHLDQPFLSSSLSIRTFTSTLRN